jgi:hypothetical protein
MANGKDLGKLGACPSVVALVNTAFPHEVHAHQVAMRVRATKQWLVRSGDNVVGPVSIELIERGLAAGKIPPDAEMTHVQGGVWRPLAEVFPPDPAYERFPPPISYVAELAPISVGYLPSSVRYPEDPVQIPKQGVLAALFG